MEISKKLFKHIDREKERDLMRSDFSDRNIERSLYRIAAIYGDCVYLYSKKKIFFLSRKSSTEIKKKKMAQLKKLFDIVMDLGVPPEVYIKAQFEQLNWLEKKGWAAYIPFSHLIGEEAIKRFKEYEARVNANYSSAPARMKEFYSTQTLDVEKAVTDSMEKFYKRLIALQEFVMGDVGISTALTELEVMSRARQVSNVYVYCSPLSGTGKSEYLDQIFADVIEKLTAPQKEIAKCVRKEYLNSPKFSNEEIKKFI